MRYLILIGALLFMVAVSPIGTVIIPDLIKHRRRRKTNEDN